MTDKPEQIQRYAANPQSPIFNPPQFPRYGVLTSPLGCAILAAIHTTLDVKALEFSMLLRPQIERTDNPKKMLRPSEDVALMPIALLNGPTADEVLYSMNLRHQWRGFSFGNFWFGYYFGTTHSSPQAEERWAVL